MTSQTNSKHGFTFAVAIALTAAVVVVGSSVWAGNGQQSMVASDDVRIDVSVMMARAEIANLPVVQVAEPF
jgi:hypothetical protein